MTWRLYVLVSPKFGTRPQWLHGRSSLLVAAVYKVVYLAAHMRRHAVLRDGRPLEDVRSVCHGGKHLELGFVVEQGLLAAKLEVYGSISARKKGEATH